MRITGLTVAILASGALMTGCALEDPCRRLAAPTPAELSAARSGADVERELRDGTECELVGGHWQRERD